jgi:hypothetical protein
VGQEFGVLIQPQSMQARRALAGFLGGFLKRDEDAAFDKLGNNARGIHQNNRIVTSIAQRLL